MMCLKKDAGCYFVFYGPCKIVCLCVQASGQNPGGQLTLGFMPSLRQVSALCFLGDTDLDILTQVRSLLSPGELFSICFPGNTNLDVLTQVNHLLIFFLGDKDLDSVM